MLSKGGSSKNGLFKNIHFVITGTVKKEIIDLLKAGGAEECLYFSDYVTHCIAGENPSEDDITDSNDLYKIPAITSSWVALSVKCNKLLSTKGFKAGEGQLFFRVVVCISQLSAADTKAIWAMIKYYGGKFSLKLTEDTTHLIVGKPIGAKYEYVCKKYKLSMEKTVSKDKDNICLPVTPDWVTDSIHAGSRCSETLYHPRLLSEQQLYTSKNTDNLSITDITGFTDITVHQEETIDASTSNNNHLERLKKRLPWNQPDSSASVKQPPLPSLKKPQPSSGLTISPPSYPQPAPSQALVQQQQPHNQKELLQNTIIVQQRPSLSVTPPVPQGQPQQSYQGQQSQQQCHWQQDVPGHPSPSQVVPQQIQECQPQQINLEQQWQVQQRLYNEQQNEQQQLVQAVPAQWNTSCTLTSHIHQGQPQQLYPGQMSQQQLKQQQQQQQVEQQVFQAYWEPSITLTQQIQQGQPQQLYPEQNSYQQQQQQHQVQQQNSQYLLKESVQSQWNPSHALTPEIQQDQPQKLYSGQKSKQEQQQLHRQQLLHEVQWNTSHALVPEIQQDQYQQFHPGQKSKQQQQQQLLQETESAVSNLSHSLTPQIQHEPQRLGPGQKSQQEQQQKKNQYQRQIPQQTVPVQCSISDVPFIQQDRSQQMVTGQQNQLQQHLYNQQQDEHQIYRHQQQLMQQSHPEHLNPYQIVAPQISQGQSQHLNPGQKSQFDQQMHQYQQQQLSPQTLVCCDTSSHYRHSHMLVPQIQHKLQKFSEQSTQQINQNQFEQQFQNQQVLQQSCHQQQLKTQPKKCEYQEQTTKKSVRLMQRQLKYRLHQQHLKQQQCEQSVVPQTQQGLSQQLIPEQQRKLQQQIRISQQAKVDVNGGTQQFTDSDRQLEQQQTSHYEASSDDIQVTFQQLSKVQQQQNVQQMQQSVHQRKKCSQSVNEARSGVAVASWFLHQMIHKDNQTQLNQVDPHIFTPGLKNHGQLDSQNELQVQQQTLTKEGQIQRRDATHQARLGSNSQQGSQVPMLQQQQLLNQQQQNVKLQSLQQLQQSTALNVLGSSQDGVSTPVERPGVTHPSILERPNTKKEDLSLNQAQDLLPYIQSKQHSLVVNDKTKTAPVNMFRNRLLGNHSPINSQLEDNAASQHKQMAQYYAQQYLKLFPVQPPTSAPPSVAASPQHSTLGALADSEKATYSTQSAVPVAIDVHEGGGSVTSTTLRPTQPQADIYGCNANPLPSDRYLLGCVFLIVEYDLTSDEVTQWLKVINEKGGKTNSSYSVDVSHVLCLTQNHPLVQLGLRDSKRCVTGDWLNDIITKQQMLPPWLALHFPTPFNDEKPCQNLAFSYTGCEGEERLRLKRMIEKVGAYPTPYYTSQNHILVCCRPGGPKYKIAQEYGRRVVNIQWLNDILFGDYSCLQQADAQKYHQYDLVNPFRIDYTLITHLMVAWKMPINVQQSNWENSRLSMSNGRKRLRTETRKTRMADTTKTADTENRENREQQILEIKITSPNAPSQLRKPCIKNASEKERKI